MTGSIIVTGVIAVFALLMFLYAFVERLRLIPSGIAAAARALRGDFSPSVRKA